MGGSEVIMIFPAIPHSPFTKTCSPLGRMNIKKEKGEKAYRRSGENFNQIPWLCNM